MPESRLSTSTYVGLPDECWLDDPDGNRYATELRLVALDATHS